MTKLKLYRLLFSIILLGIFGCKTTHHAQKHPKKPKKPPVVTKDSVLFSEWERISQSAKNKAFQYKTLALTGKMYAEMPKQGLNGVTVNYRVNMKKDSIIWIKISLLGIEGMRALITPDSIKVLDRQSNIAHIAPFSRVKEFTGLEISFHHLQALMVGNLAEICNEMKIKEEGRMDYITECQKDSFRFEYEIQRESFRPARVLSEKLDASIRVNMNYADFQPESTGLFARQIDMELFSEKQGKNTASLTHSKVEINPEGIGFGFAIPGNFKIQKD